MQQLIQIRLYLAINHFALLGLNDFWGINDCKVFLEPSGFMWGLISKLVVDETPREDGAYRTRHGRRGDPQGSTCKTTRSPLHGV
mmetsp:Transcript_7356/g.12995  ORF Transcript_7356/g.12995 Transcript_7356/m.12995 type:complete len:85 (-) Transcript_7356:33-287(-)